MLKQKLDGSFARLASFAHKPMMTQNDGLRNENLRAVHPAALAAHHLTLLKSMFSRSFSITRLIPDMTICLI